MLPVWVTATLLWRQCVGAGSNRPGFRFSGTPLGASGRDFFRVLPCFAEGQCVETAALPRGSLAIRNSREPDGHTLVYTRDEIFAFGSARPRFGQSYHDPIRRNAREPFAHPTLPPGHPHSMAPDQLPRRCRTHRLRAGLQCRPACLIRLRPTVQNAIRKRVRCVPSVNELIWAGSDRVTRQYGVEHMHGFQRIVWSRIGTLAILAGLWPRHVAGRASFPAWETGPRGYARLPPSARLRLVTVSIEVRHAEGFLVGVACQSCECPGGSGIHARSVFDS